MSFPWPEAGTRIEDLPTPMPVIDEDRLAKNIARAQGYLDGHGKAFRPHIKTHKIPAVARAQLAAGAVGINCQKVTEAEAFADAGFEDILVTYNILGPAKLARLAALNARVPRLAVIADSAATVAGYAAAFAAARPLSVLVECDTGGGRVGVQSPADAVALAREIAAAPGLRFGGLLTYPAIGGAARVEAFFAETMALLAADGHRLPGALERRQPGFLLGAPRALGDRAPGGHLRLQRPLDGARRPLHRRGPGDARSRHRGLAPDRDAGGDRRGVEGADLGFCSASPTMARSRAWPGAKIVGLSEEHGMVDLSGCAGRLPEVGEVVRIVPNHTCVVSNLFDRMVFHRGGVVTRVEDVAARGTVW